MIGAAGTLTPALSSFLYLASLKTVQERGGEGRDLLNAAWASV